MSPRILGGDRDPVFPWVRYWTPANKSIQLGASSFWGGDSDGFLADPEDKLLGAENRHLLSTERLLEPRAGCFVLCGEPGMGKSRALDAALRAHANPHRIFLEFRDIATWAQFCRQTFDSALWRSWREGTHLLSLVVDGVDEGLIKIDGFVGALAGALKLNTEPLARLQLVLACRSWEWPQSEGERLLALWPGAAPKGSEAQAHVVSGLYELCPLRDRDARLAADASLAGLPGDKKTGVHFMRELRRHRLIALGSRPLTLKMLLREFAEGAGAFPRSHRELYRRCTRTLISERDEGRRSRLRNKPLPRLTASENKRLRVAQRIAALMLLCGRSAIAHSSVRETDASDLTFAEMQHGEERIGDIPFEVDEAIIDAVLETPLFWPKTAGRADFYHRTFAEHLAAGYLSSLPFPQQRSLLFQRDEHGEHVHPQLGELAAWLAGESDLLLRHLLAYDPEVLLRSDVSGVRDEQKATLVAAILAKARAEELFDGAGVSRFFHTLRHPSLASQLRQTLHDRSANHVARRLCFSIAEACRLEEMLPDAIRYLRSPEDRDLHHVAAGALDNLATPQTAHQLIPFLRKGCAHRECLMILHTLLKHGVWSVSRALPHVPRALPRDSHSGGILAQHSTPADADALLRACLIWPGCFDTLSRFHPFVREAYRHAVARIGEPRIRILLARVWWRARRRYQEDGFVRGDRDDDDRTPLLPDLLKDDARLRHRFVADLVSVARGTHDQRRWLIGDLLHREDFSEVIERACVGSKRRKRIYAQLAAHRYRYSTGNAEHSSLLIEALPRSVELREAFPWMRLWQIGAPDFVEAAEQHREWLKEQEDMERRRKAWAKPKPAPKTVWRRDLKLLDLKNPPTHWLTLADRLSYHVETARDSDEKRHDLTTTPGWKFHDAAARERIRDGARRLILKVAGNPHHQIGAGQSEFDELAYKALFLLRPEIESDPALTRAVRRHWLPTIFDEFSNTDAHHLEMMALAYRLDAERMRGFLREKILRSANQGEGHCLALREFAACWDAGLATFVIKVFAREVRSPAATREAMEYLAEHDATAAILLWRRLRTRHQRKPEWPAFAAATSALAGSRLFVFWEELWPVLMRETGLARHVFLTMDRMDQREFIKNIENVPPRRLGELYLYLLALFPKREDPPISVGRTYSPTPRMDMARMRDEFPALLGSTGSAEAVEELERIARRVPAADAVWIRWRKQAALVALRRGSWRPPAAEDVLALVEKAERRWIQDEDDLMALVLESLERLQTNLRASPNSSRDRFWTRAGEAKKGSRVRPQDEVSMSRVIAQWLEVDLDKSKGLSVLRELQIQHNNRTDIEVSAVAVGPTPRSQRAIQVVIEVKGHWHPKIKTAHRDQLVRDYLQGCGRTHGIYLIVWTQSEADPRRSPLKAKSPKDAQSKLAELIAPYDGKQTPEILSTLVLDARIR